MAGHSKWANIRHRKAAQDAKRGKVFTKLIRELVVAAKQGGSNAEDNPRLRAAVDKALSANMKRDTVEKAIARGAGDNDVDNYDEITYEGYAPGGVAVLIETMTDNRNRTVAEVRHCFSKCGGSLGTEGSVAYLFSRKGQIFIPSCYVEDELLELALDAGAEDMIMSDDGYEIVTHWTEVSKVKTALSEEGVEILAAEVAMVASTNVDLNENAKVSTRLLIEAFEDLDDVQNVYTNASL